jgi:hypothetical protein
MCSAHDAATHSLPNRPGGGRLGGGGGLEPRRAALSWPPTRARSSAPNATARSSPAWRTGAKIGPLLADDVEAADALLTGLPAAAGPDTEVFVDMPTANPATRELRGTRAMEPVFETARMYLHGEPLEDLHRIVGITTLEFG